MAIPEPRGAFDVPPQANAIASEDVVSPVNVTRQFDELSQIDEIHEANATFRTDLTPQANAGFRVDITAPTNVSHQIGETPEINVTVGADTASHVQASSHGLVASQVDAASGAETASQVDVPRQGDAAPQVSAVASRIDTASPAESNSQVNVAPRIAVTHQVSASSEVLGNSQANLASRINNNKDVLEWKHTGLRLDLVPFNLKGIHGYEPGGYHPVHLGDAIDKAYRIIHKLGHGGFATIWLTRDLNSQDTTRYVALKILRAGGSVDNCPELLLGRLASQGTGKEENREHVCFPLRRFKIDGPNGTHLCFVYPVLGPRVSYGVLQAEKDLEKILRHVPRRDDCYHLPSQRRHLSWR